ncbi:HU family DNA-binding protein [Spiroplasma ixodetis]|uniref:HU family DNA-binding protein n=1 Tax=Spiroplasma ixodetis TaxID=2141 RepID=UPI0025773ABA|nr:HU family DNA-binding protein [Spiroplasma ixodetis]WJG70350.1 hypothetical protein SIXOD_v1c14720 [Spiroplasma ixodetis Y32]
MEKKELMKLVSEKTNFYLEHVELVFDAIFEEIKYQNKQEKSVNIKEIANFKIVKVQPKNRRNKKNNKIIKVKPYNIIRFQPTETYLKEIKKYWNEKEMEVSKYENMNKNKFK